MAINFYEGEYIYNGLSYNIMDTLEVHDRLKNDDVFFQSYMKNNLGCLEVAGSNDDDTSCSTLTENCSEHIASNALDSTIEEGNKQQWTVKGTKLLLELYRERKDKFRDPKTKKRSLWTEIVNEMHKGGYKHLTEDALDRKLRNLKKTFRTIKDNNRKSSTGRGRISWEYYDTFEDIFSDDRTINFGPTISSMDPAAAATSQFTQSASTIMSPTSTVTSTAPSSSTRLLASPAPTRLPALVSPVRTPSPAPTRLPALVSPVRTPSPAPTRLPALVSPVRTPSPAPTRLPALVSPVRTPSPAPAKYVCRIPSISTPPPALSPALTHISSDSFDSTVVDDSFCEENITNSPYTAAAEHSFSESESAFGSLSNSASEYATPTNSASEYATSSRTQRQKRKCKEMTSKEAYDVRKKLLLIENERIKAINELNKNIEHNNRIQQERNDLLKKLVDKMLK